LHDRSSAFCVGVDPDAVNIPIRKIARPLWPSDRCRPAAWSCDLVLAGARRHRELIYGRPDEANARVVPASLEEKAMKPTTRRFVQSGLAAGALTAVPAVSGRNRRRPPRAPFAPCLHGDLRVFDPVWTTANMTSLPRRHGLDTLFGVDDKFEAKPQMVSKWGLLGRPQDL